MRLITKAATKAAEPSTQRRRIWERDTQVGIFHRFSPSTYTARRTCPYSSARFIPLPASAASRQMGSCAGFLLRRNRRIQQVHCRASKGITEDDS
jgi:hypothetical protein